MFLELGENMKKKPVLVESTCNLMEQLRMAIEVHSGLRTNFVHLDFNTKRGCVEVGEGREELSFVCDDKLILAFELSRTGKLIVLFSGGFRKARVAYARTPYGLCWAGSSANDRRREVLPPWMVEQHKKYCLGKNVFTKQ